MLAEESRIRAVYERRRSQQAGAYSWFDIGHVFLMQELEKEVLRALTSHHINTLGDKRILEIGCGTGFWLSQFVKYGAKPSKLFGIDLLPWRIQAAQELLPRAIRLDCGNADHLDFPDAAVDLVCQFTVFSSILDLELRSKVAREMLRVLRPDGLILWYDFFVDNPRNPDVRGITMKEIHQLFPGCRIDFKRVTLAPPLARVLARYSPLLSGILGKLRVLNTHYLATVHKSPN